MSNPSYLRRTEDLKRLKTRALYVQGPDGSLPGTNTLPVFGTAGDIQFSEIQVIGGDSMIIPGDLTVDGSLTVGTLDASSGVFGTVDATVGNFQDLSATAATIQDLSASTLYATTASIGTLDVSGSATFTGGVSTNYLDVCGSVNIMNAGSSLNVYNTSGIHTFVIPADVTSLDFEMIGSGGAPGGGGNIGGTGGYMRGSINVGAFAGQTLTVNVGAAGGSTSYIAIAGTVLFTVAGGGGGGGGPVGGVNGGAGGGDSFVASVANGKDGVDYPGIANSYGRGGSATGGAGGAPLPGPPGISNGQAGANPAGFTDAAGGASGAGARGGNGYAGGGESGSAVFGAGSGGGGSSFYNTTYVSLIEHYAGDNPGLVGILTGYGRSSQSGYVSLSYSGEPSLQTSGDIVCGGNLDVCGSFSILGDFEIDGVLTIGGRLQYRQVNGTLYHIPQRVLIYSSTGLPIGPSPTTFNIFGLGAPFDTLTKIEVDVNGQLPLGEILYGRVNNNIVSLAPLAECVSGALNAIFTATHTFEMSKTPAFKTHLFDYGKYNAVDPAAGSTKSGQYNATNINITPDTTIKSFGLSTISSPAFVYINIYAYV